MGCLEPGVGRMPAPPAHECVYFPRLESQQGSCWIPSSPGQEASPPPPQAGHIVLENPSSQSHFGGRSASLYPSTDINLTQSGPPLSWNQYPALSASSAPNHRGTLRSPLPSLPSVSPFC